MLRRSAMSGERSWLPIMSQSTPPRCWCDERCRGSHELLREPRAGVWSGWPLSQCARGSTEYGTKRPSLRTTVRVGFRINLPLSYWMDWRRFGCWADKVLLAEMAESI